MSQTALDPGNGYRQNARSSPTGSDYRTWPTTTMTKTGSRRTRRDAQHNSTVLWPAAPHVAEKTRTRNEVTTAGVGGTILQGQDWQLR
eukprot:7159512-Pyramimonas_sp.AAC.1